MRFFTVIEIYRSMFFSVIIGSIFGCLYIASENLLISLKKFLLIFKAVYLRHSKKEIIKNDIVKLSGFLKNIYEFILFITLGVCVILVSYTELDGVFRLYVIFFVLLSFMLSKSLFGVVFIKIYTYIFNKIYGLLYEILYYFSKPLYFVFSLLLRFYINISVPVKRKHNSILNNKIKKRKIREIKHLSSL